MRSCPGAPGFTTPPAPAMRLPNGLGAKALPMAHCRNEPEVWGERYGVFSLGGRFASRS